MTWANRGILLLLVLAAAVAVEASTPTITVDCNKGQSLNQTLSKLDRNAASTVTVSGTCTEYIQIIGFHNLTLNGTTGATLLQPTTRAGSIFNALLYIESSQSVTVNGFGIQADTATDPAIGIGHGSSDVRLRHLNIQGGTFGIVIFENSQVSIAYVTAENPGYATLGVYDSSDVHVEHCAFENVSGDLWHVGMAVGASHITVYGTTITNMQVGIAAYQNSIIDLVVFTTYYTTSGSTDVVINSPAGTNYNGVQIGPGGSLNLGSARLVIDRPGQSWGGTTGGVLLNGDAALYAGNGYLVITGSHGQGVMALDNSQATLVGATVTGGSHGGLVATNLSSIDVGAGTTLTLVGGNIVDLFCDSDSWIVGSVNLSGVPTAQCTNLLSAETVTLP